MADRKELNEAREALHAAEERSASWAHGYQRIHHGHQFLVRAITALRAEVAERIRECRADEAKFVAAAAGIDAARERMVLQPILASLDAAFAGLPATTPESQP